MTVLEQDVQSLVSRLIREFEKKSGLTGVCTEIKPAWADVPTLIFRIAHPVERYYQVLLDIKEKHKSDLEGILQVSLLKTKSKVSDSSAEKNLFLQTLSESLVVNRYSFQEDFFSRYIKTASGAEERIISNANHIVFGRRGSGKSTLLLYALHSLKQQERMSVWVDLQLYSRRKDEEVIADVLCEILEQFGKKLRGTQIDLVRTLRVPGGSLDTIRRLLPSIKNCLVPRLNDSFIFLDDFHVVDQAIQPRLLDVLYSITRGSGIYIKISSIDTLTSTYDPHSREGMQHHDIQKLSLDYNLTTPDSTYKHITSILDSIANYCGLSSTRNLCTGDDVLKRLVLTTAGVPRDALSVFSQAMSKSQESLVSVQSINTAALGLKTTKMSDLENDINESSSHLKTLATQIEQFCFQHNNNAFLVKKNHLFQDIMRLVDLRLLHIIQEGFTPNKAGKQFAALMLDYGFYVSERKSPRIVEFNPNLETIETKALRKLPTFVVQEQQ